MTIYIPMIILTVFLADIQERIRYRGRKISILLITLLPPTLVAAFRYNNGADYPMYFQLFTRLGNGSKIAGIEGKKLEVGFEYIVRLCQLVTRNQWFTFGAISFIISFLIFKECLNDSDDYRLSVLFYFVTGVYFDAYNGLRQYIAVSICFYLPTFYFMFAVIILECKENRLKGNFYKHLRSTSETMYFIHMYFVAFCALVLYKDDYNNFKSYLICAGGALAVSEIYSWMKNISNRSTTVSRLKHD